MARKLKSDKLLFTATLLLVCTGVVMVYSASAVMAMQRFQNPYLFLVKQVAWALIGLAALPVVMRVDYRNYRQPAGVGDAVGVGGGGGGGGARRAGRAAGRDARGLPELPAAGGDLDRAGDRRVRAGGGAVRAAGQR